MLKFRLWHPKRHKILEFLPLRGTTSIPTPQNWEFPGVSLICLPSLIGSQCIPNLDESWWALHTHVLDPALNPSSSTHSQQNDVWRLIIYYRLCSCMQMLSTCPRFFYKNNFIRTTKLKFAQKLWTILEQLSLGFRCKCNCKFLLKNTTHHVITCGVHCRSFCSYEHRVSTRENQNCAAHLLWLCRSV